MAFGRVIPSSGCGLDVGRLGGGVETGSLEGEHTVTCLSFNQQIIQSILFENDRGRGDVGGVRKKISLER